VRKAPLRPPQRQKADEVSTRWQGAVRNAVGIRVGELSGNMKLSFQAARSIGLINGFCGEGLPTIDLAHADLSRGEQRPEHHRGGVGRRQHGLGLIRRLNSSCNRSIAFVVRRLPGPNR
jgi:hypothetical protein